MGYSIACHCRTRALAKRMTDFMEKNYRGWPKVMTTWCGDAEYSRLASNLYQESSRLSYDNAKNAVGFDYNACEPERDYIFAVTRWMVLKVGERRAFRGLRGKAPCFFYDGGHCADDRWPTLVRNEWKEVPDRWRWCLCDATGFRSLRDRYVGVPLYEDMKKKGPRALEKYFKGQLYLYYEYVKGGPDAVNKAIARELVRLERLWGMG